MKPIQSEIEKLRQRYLENEYPGDLSEILGPRNNLAPPLQSAVHLENTPGHPHFIRWSLVATLLLGLSLGLVWALAPQKNVAPIQIPLSKETTSKSQTARRSSLWPSGSVDRMFQKNHAVTNAFSLSASTAQSRMRLTKLPQPSPSTSSRQLAKNLNQTNSPPSFWKGTPLRGSVFNPLHKKTSDGVKKTRRPKRSIFVPQRHKLNPIHSLRRS